MAQRDRYMNVQKRRNIKRTETYLYIGCYTAPCMCIDVYVRGVPVTLITGHGFLTPAPGREGNEEGGKEATATRIRSVYGTSLSAAGLCFATQSFSIAGSVYLIVFVIVICIVICIGVSSGVLTAITVTARSIRTAGFLPRSLLPAGYVFLVQEGETFFGESILVDFVFRCADRDVFKSKGN